MENTPSIQSRIDAMKKFHESGIRTTCFISPIFPGITNVVSIIEEIKDFCDYIWLENLNLRGGFKSNIINYINEKNSELKDLYTQIYTQKDMSYWQELDKSINQYAKENGFIYVIDKEPFLRNPHDKPIIINYFYHDKIKQSSKNK